MNEAQRRAWLTDDDPRLTTDERRARAHRSLLELRAAQALEGKPKPIMKKLSDEELLKIVGISREEWERELSDSFPPRQGDGQ